MGDFNTYASFRCIVNTNVSSLYDPGLNDENKEKLSAMLNEPDSAIELLHDGKTFSRKVYVRGAVREEIDGPIGEEFERETPLGKIKVLPN